MTYKPNIYLSILVVIIFYMFLSCGTTKYNDVSNKTLESSLLIPKIEIKKDAILKLITVDDELALQVKNQSYIDLEIILEPIIKNLDTISRVVHKGDSIVLKKWKNKDSKTVLADFKSNYEIKSYYGNPSSIKPDTTYKYRLPFKENKKYEVAQSFYGTFSHNSESSRYAIDFVMKIGEPVYAARGGLVIKTVRHFKKNGGKSFRKKANRILVLHDDGTIASYVHLDYKGVFVNEGDKIVRGQKIGLSGFTGYTRGPHLHFVVRKERDISIPVYFEGYENDVLKKGKRYRIR